MGAAFGVGMHALVGVSFGVEAGNFSCSRETRFAGKMPSRHQSCKTRPTRPLSWGEISSNSSATVLSSLPKYFTAGMRFIKGSKRRYKRTYLGAVLCNPSCAYHICFGHHF